MIIMILWWCDESIWVRYHSGAILELMMPLGWFEFSVTRKLNKILPNVWKKWPKIAKYLHQSLIWKPKTSTLNYFWNLWTSHGLKLIVLGEIGFVKIGLKGKILRNLVTLFEFVMVWCYEAHGDMWCWFDVLGWNDKEGVGD